MSMCVAADSSKHYWCSDTAARRLPVTPLAVTLLHFKRVYPELLRLPKDSLSKEVRVIQLSKNGGNFKLHVEVPHDFVKT